MKLELGGGRLVEDGWTCVDCGDFDQEYVVDIDAEGLPFEDNSVDALRSHYFLEHIANTIFVMNECWRVLKPGGEFSIKVPRFPNDSAVSDPTHKSCWVPDTFLKYYTGVWPVNANYGIRPWRIKSYQFYEVQMYVTLVKPRPIPIVMVYSEKRPALLEQTRLTLSGRTRYPYILHDQRNETSMPRSVAVRNEMLWHSGDWEFLVSMDDDLFLNDGWLCEMVEALRLHPEVWVLAGTTYLTHRAIEAGGPVTIAETAPGPCLLITRRAWDECGPFDVELPRGKLWDDEFCQRVRRAGGEVAFLSDQTRVVHCGITGTNGKGRSAEAEAWMRKLADEVGATAL